MVTMVVKVVLWIMVLDISLLTVSVLKVLMNILIKMVPVELVLVLNLTSQLLDIKMFMMEPSDLKKP